MCVFHYYLLPMNPNYCLIFSLLNIVLYLHLFHYLRLFGLMLLLLSLLYLLLLALLCLVLCCLNRIHLILLLLCFLLYFFANIHKYQLFPVPSDFVIVPPEVNVVLNVFSFCWCCCALCPLVF